ncbi:ABC transporter permease [Pseudoalteromonas piscicida]|uniref:ABC transporter permease n=1 Tax=Pseudoalteromonas piscicida TaxID=43662 RepID=UPI0027E55094|nr:ABC transporter permease [Pseudoalteromonas piscicida]WMO14239.1 ABC transporter permease [Pseudoalteromonas piscicida]
MGFLQLRRQLGLAIKSLVQVPNFCITLVLTLALALSCFFVALSLFSGFFIKPLEIENESRFVVVEQKNVYQDRVSEGLQSFQNMLNWYQNPSVYEKRALISSFSDVVENLAGKPKLTLTFASSDYFSMVKMPLALGRYLTPTKSISQKNPEVIISYQLWQQYFNGDDNVLGESLRIVGRLYTIVGVAARTHGDPYFLSEGNGALWLSFSEDERFLGDQRGEYHPWSSRLNNLKLLAILPANSGQDILAEQLYQNAQLHQSEWKSADEALLDLEPIVRSYREVELAGHDKLAIIVLLSVSCLVLIAIFNVSNLFISRAHTIQQQLALQAMLGAKRKLLFRGILLEALLLVSGAVLVGLFIAAWELRLVKSLTSGYLPLIDTLTLDTTVLLSAILTALLLALLFAFVTSRMIDFSQLKQSMQSSGKGSVKAVRIATTKTLVAVQLFFTTVLVLGATLVLCKSADTLLRPLGTKLDNMYSVMLHIPADPTPFPARYANIEGFKLALANIPGVLGVAHGESPLQSDVPVVAMQDMAGEWTPSMVRGNVGPDYFALTGLELVAGRTFSEAAIRGEKEEAIISLAAAQALKPGGDVIGETYFIFNPDVPAEIVGISKNFNHPKRHHELQGKTVWLPALPLGYPFMIEMEPGASLTRAQIQNAISTVNGQAGIWRFSNLTKTYQSITYLERLTLLLSFALCGFCLLLSGVGIYGVLNYSFQQRRYEFGMRMALGAKKQRLYRLLLSDTIAPMLVAMLAAIMVVAGFYMSVSSDWLLAKSSWLLVVIVTMLAFALATAIYPMRQLINSTPMRALKH